MNLAESLGFVPQKTARAVRAINVGKLIPNPANFYHIGSLDELKASILEDGGVRQNLIVEPKGDGTYIIISGHRRCQAVKELLADGADVEADLPCEIEPDHAKAERLLIRANSAARILTPWEEVLQAQRADEIITRQRQEGVISETKRQAMQTLLHKSSGTIGRLCAIYNNLIVDLQQKMKDGKLGVSVAYEICQLRPEDQKGLFDGVTKFDIEEISLADVRHYKDMNGISNKPADDPRQTTIMDFIDDKPAEEPADDPRQTTIMDFIDDKPAEEPTEDTRTTVEATQEQMEPAVVETEPAEELEEKKDIWTAQMEDLQAQIDLKNFQTVADSVWQRTCSLWRLHDKYVNGNITTENYIAESQVEARTLYQELDHLRVLHEKAKKNKGEGENQ